MNAPRCDQTDAWTTLNNHFKAHGRNFDLCKAFELDGCRCEDLAIEAPEVFPDLPKNCMNRSRLQHLIALARECRVEERRARMFSGYAPRRT
jgi:glucose-6-phosphate isomerase